jgi:hypothetical protein
MNVAVWVGAMTTSTVTTVLAPVPVGGRKSFKQPSGPTKNSLPTGVAATPWHHRCVAGAALR